MGISEIAALSKVSQRLQAYVLQSSVNSRLVLLSSHGTPPPVSQSAIVRICLRSPPPHNREHEVQSSYSLYTQSWTTTTTSVERDSGSVVPVTLPCIRTLFGSATCSSSVLLTPKATSVAEFNLRELVLVP